MFSHPSPHFLTVRRGPGSFLVKEIKFPLVGLLIEQDTTFLSEQTFHFGWLGCLWLPCFLAGGQPWFSSGFRRCHFTFSPLHTISWALSHTSVSDFAWPELRSGLIHDSLHKAFTFCKHFCMEENHIPGRWAAGNASFCQWLKHCCLSHLCTGLFKQRKTPENTGSAYSFCPACPALVSALMQTNTFASKFHSSFTPEELFLCPSPIAAPTNHSHNLILRKNKTKCFSLLLVLNVPASQHGLSEWLAPLAHLIIRQMEAVVRQVKEPLEFGQRIRLNTFLSQQFQHLKLWKKQFTFFFIVAQHCE